MASSGIGCRITRRGATTRWTPLNLPELLGLWYAHDALTAIGPDIPATLGQTVRRVPDASSNGWHLDQPTGTYQPLAGHWSGMSGSVPTCLNYNGVNQVMRTDARSLMITRTLIMVCEITAPSEAKVVMELGGNWDIHGHSYTIDPGGLMGAFNISQSGAGTTNSSAVRRRGATPINSAGGRGRVLLVATFGPMIADLSIRSNNSLLPLTDGSGNEPLASGPFNGRFSVMGRVGISGDASAINSSGKVAMAAVVKGKLSDQDRLNLYQYCRKEGWLP